MGTLFGLDAAAIGQLSATRIKALTMADILGMTGEQISGLTSAQTSLFSPLQLLALSRSQIPHLTADAVKGFTPGQLALLVPQADAFTPEQLAGLETGQLAVIAPSVLATRIQNQVQAQIAQALTQVPGMDALQLTSLEENPALPLIPALPTIVLPPAPTLPDPTPPLPPPPPPVIETPVLPEPPPAPVITTPTLPDPAPAPVIETPVLPDPTPPATVIETPTLPDPTPPAPTMETLLAPTNETPAPSPDPEPQALAAPVGESLTPAQLGAMTGAQIAALSAEQIKSFNAEQLAALAINYDKVLAILQASADGGITAGEFAALQALAGKFNVTDGITVSGYLEQITDNVVFGDPANATWTGGLKTPTALGNMAPGFTEVQADQLIGKWFLGSDLPSSKVRIDLAPNFTVTHSVDPDPLYSDGVSMWDINQGNLGDCFFLAPLAAVAARNPSAIESMITDNSNGSYGVCFVVNGKNEYVTVDDQLANGGTVFNHDDEDWAGLLEKAYAQLQGGGNVTGNKTGYGNSYTNLANGGSPESALAAITGARAVIDYVADGASWKSYTFDGASLTIPDSPNGAKVIASDKGISNDALFNRLLADIQAGDYLVLSSQKDAKNAAGKSTLIADHAMAIYDVDASTGMLEVYNPWGKAESGLQPWESTFEVSLSRLLADGDIISVATNRLDPGGLSTPTTSLFQPSNNPIGMTPSLLGIASVA
jgi:hypothetical protein